MEPRKIRDARDASECLAAAAAAGRAPTDWAHANGVNARSLNAWRIGPPKPRPRSPVRLVELVPTLAPSARYRVLAGAYIVEVDAAFEAEVLERLLRVVASAC